MKTHSLSLLVIIYKRQNLCICVYIVLFSVVDIFERRLSYFSVIGIYVSVFIVHFLWLAFLNGNILYLCLLYFSVVGSFEQKNSVSHTIYVYIILLGLHIQLILSIIFLCSNHSMWSIMANYVPIVTVIYLHLLWSCISVNKC